MSNGDLNIKEDTGFTKNHPFIRLIVESIQLNHEYLRDYSKNLYSRIVLLINRAIDYSIQFPQGNDQIPEIMKSAKNHFIYFILTPHSNAIYIDALVGNIPSIFVEMRIILEALAENYLADKKYPHEVFFIQRLDNLRAETKGKWPNISDRMDQLEKSLKLRGIKTLWQRLSNEWIHPRGIMDQIIEGMSSLSMPAWFLAIPNTYSDTDTYYLRKCSRYLWELMIIVDKALESEK